MARKCLNGRHRYFFTNLFLFVSSKLACTILICHGLDCLIIEYKINKNKSLSYQLCDKYLFCCIKALVLYILIIIIIKVYFFIIASSLNICYKSFIQDMSNILHIKRTTFLYTVFHNEMFAKQLEHILFRRNTYNKTKFLLFQYMSTKGN